MAKRTQLWKPLVAFRAFMLFLSSMSRHVTAYIALYWKSFPHSVHSGGFSPVWISMWRWRWANKENLLWHSEHSCGFSPVWVNMWRFKWLFTANLFWHSVHSCYFFPVWVSMWMLRLSRQLNYFFCDTCTDVCGKGLPLFLHTICTHSLLILVIQWCFLMIMPSKSFVITFHRSTVSSLNEVWNVCLLISSDAINFLGLLLLFFGCS